MAKRSYDRRREIGTRGLTTAFRRSVRHRRQPNHTMQHATQVRRNAVAPPTDSEPEGFSLPAGSESLLDLHDDPVRVVDFTVYKRTGAGAHSEVAATYTGVLHSEYADSRIWRDTQDRAMGAWEDMKFPLPRDHWMNPPEFSHTTRNSRYWRSSGSPITAHRGRVATEIRDSSGAKFFQYPDGSGVVEYHNDPTAVRTSSGLMLVAKEDQKRIAGSWWWHYEYPPKLGGRTYGHEDGSYDYRVPLINLREMDGTPPLTEIIGVEEGGEETTHGRLRTESFYVHYADGTRVVIVKDDTAADRDDRWAGFVVEDETEPFPPVDDAERLLMPPEVLRAVDAGMNIVTSDEFADGADFRHGLCGDVIVRQGEWYLIPKAEGWGPDTIIYKPFAEQRFRHGHLDTDMDLEVDADRFYDANDEVLNSHTPRDLTFDGGGNITVRGTFRHLDGEHRMLNLGERWHEAHENVRDVTVFSVRRGNYASAGTGNGMRVE